MVLTRNEQATREDLNAVRCKVMIDIINCRHRYHNSKINVRLEVGWLEYNVLFQHKYGYIRDERVLGEKYAKITKR